MTRIDSITQSPDRAGRFHVKLSDGRVWKLYRQTVEDFALYAGREVTAEELSRIEDSADTYSAKMRAVRIVSASNVSRRDLEQRLVRKGEAPQKAREAVQWMEELNLVDDRVTARQIVERCIGKGYGPARAKQALYEKQIPKSLWEEVLADYPDQTEHILKFLKTKLTDPSDPKQTRRAVDALLRRGHSYRQIKTALDLMGTDMEFEEY